MTCDVVSLATARRLKDAGWTADTELFFVGDVLYRRKDVTDIAEYDVSAPCLCDFIREFVKNHIAVMIIGDEVRVVDERLHYHDDTPLFKSANKITVEAAAEYWMWLRKEVLKK